MNQQTIEKTKKVIIPTFMLLFIFGAIESVMTSNEFGLTKMILDKYLPLIIFLSTLMSLYWILLTEDFWDLFEYEIKYSVLIRTIGKFLIWIPGMGLCFYLTTQGILSVYNRKVGEQLQISLKGKIIDKNNFRQRFYFEIYEKSLGRNIEIKISASDFKNYNIGDQYEIKRKIGSLGFIYN